MKETENQETITKKDKFRSRIKERYPDIDLDDEEGFYAALDGDYETFDSEKTKRNEADQRISELFTSNPMFASFFMDTANGESPVIAFIRHFGKEALELTDDEETLKKITEADESYKNKVKESTRIAEEQQANLENSQSVFDEFQNEYKLSDEEMGAIIESLCNRSCSIFMGIFQKEDLVSEWNAKNYDADVDSARMEGEAKGRNAKINENKKKKTLPEGMPAVLGGAASPKETKKDPTVESLDRIASSNNDIWNQ